MKNLKTIILCGLAGSLTVACGRYDKHPVSDIEQFRSEAAKVKDQGEAERIQAEANRQKTIAQLEEDKRKLAEAVKKAEERANAPLPKGNDIIKEIIVEKPVEVIREQATVDDKYVVIKADQILQFVETQAGSYQISGRSLVKGMKIELTATNLPEGAKFEKASAENENVVYKLTWTPGLYTVAANDYVKFHNLKILAKVIAVPEGKNKEALQALMKEKETLLVVGRLKQAPSGLQVEGLPAEIQSGSLTPFSVTVTVPGIDDKATEKPILTVYYDKQPYVAGAPQLGLDGSRYVVIEPEKSQAVYLGESKWKYSMLFDTQQISVQPARGKDGKVIPNAEYTAVRLSFKVSNPTLSLTSPPVVKQIKIKGAATGVAP